MLTGFYFIAALIGVFVVVMWEITNDRVDLTGETRGLLRMRKERPRAENEEE
jgi:hypothetical protein